MAEAMMKPKVLKRGEKLHLSYELPHRIHCAEIYPLAAPNGSAVILYGHARGLRVLWRGGARPKRRADPQSFLSRPNGISRSEVIALDSTDDEAPHVPPTGKRARHEDAENEDEEQDPDCPYPNIIQDLDIDTNSAVLGLAIPSLPTPATSLPGILQTMAVATISTADGYIRMLQIPLAPPTDEEKKEYLDGVVRSQIELSRHRSIPSQLCMKLHLLEKPQRATRDDRISESGLQFLIASATRRLDTWVVQVDEDQMQRADHPVLKTEALRNPPSRLSFHPALRSSGLLLADSSGTVRVYDPLAPPTSSDPTLEAAPPSKLGKWSMMYHTTFSSPQQSAASPALAVRKKVLDSVWIAGGKAVLALLDDGEWGIWELSPSLVNNKPVGKFALHGFLGNSTSAQAAQPKHDRNPSSKLAPMTPNTRKAKSETLFTGVQKQPGVASSGGISVAPSNSRVSNADESVVLWYDGNVYSIPSTQSFLQRSTASGGGFGSLYSPGLIHITDISLQNENISSISQLSQQSSSAGIGHMNTQRDLLVTTDYRAIVLQALRPVTPPKPLFQRPTSQPEFRNQAMLQAGELDIGGMDRMLDSMAAAGNLGRPRKVGFAP